MKQPVDHILRPNLPWRQQEEAVTECGFDASQVKCLTRPEYFERVKEIGKQRAAMLTCMTCAQTAGSWGTWDDDPRQAILREAEWEGARWRSNSNKHGTRLRDELIAAAALIESHRDEFDAILTQNNQRRDWLEKKAARAAKPGVKRPGQIGI